MKKQKSFTLIELLVVIAIIGILAAIALPSLSNVRAKARDARRVTDLDQLAKAMELYFSDNNRYPIWESGCLETPGNPLISTTTSPPAFFSAQYMKTIPKDPLPNKYCYFYKSDGTGGNFKIAAYLEKDFVRSANDDGTASQYYEVFAGPTGRGDAISAEVFNNEILAQAMPSYTPPPPPQQYTLTVTISGKGLGTVTSNPSGINCNPDCSEAYDSDTSVTLTASPETGSTFEGWSGGDCSGTGICVVTMDASKTVNAEYYAPDLVNFDNLADYMNGHNKFKVYIGEKLIVYFQENGTTFVPGQDAKYEWITIYRSDYWNNPAGPYWARGETGWNDYGTGIWNYIAPGDCYNCYYYTLMFIGNGRSGYYQYGNKYHFDEITLDGKYFFYGNEGESDNLTGELKVYRM